MIVVLAGVSGSGKTTVGALLAQWLGWVFEDADALQPAANIAKMRAGVPLTDGDRWPWLQSVASWMDQQIRADGSAVVACSALKRSYRDLLRRGRPAVTMVMLDPPPIVLEERLVQRHGHFFPARLLRSQLADLELPGPDEACPVIRTVGPPAVVAREVIRVVGLAGAARYG